MGVGSPVGPSGEQLELSFGERRAVVVEVGAGLRTYAIGGREVLDGYAADEMCASGRGQVLLPWPNRIEDGSYEFDGRRHQLPLTEVEAGNAIHGLVRWARWTVAEREPQRVVLEHLLHPQPGYPFALALRIEYSLGDSGLTVRTTATNAGAATCPFGSGMHPYFTLGTPTVDSLTLTVPARTVVGSGPRGLPGAAQDVEGTEYDFRRPRVLGATRLDNTFTDLEPDDGGSGADPPPGRGRRGGCHGVGGRRLHPLPALHRRPAARRGPAEPRGRADDVPSERLSHGEGVVRLEPGASWTGAWGIG